MNVLLIHLAVNHAPLFAELFAILLLMWPKREVRRAALVIALVTGPASAEVFLTGRAAAEAIGRIEGVDQDAIGPHEAAAESFLAAALLASAAAAAALIADAGRWRFARLLLLAAGLLIVVALALAARTASLGGRIRHTEIAAQTLAVSR
jgi:hypothetical protein